MSYFTYLTFAKQVRIIHLKVSLQLFAQQYIFRKKGQGNNLPEYKPNKHICFHSYLEFLYMCLSWQVVGSLAELVSWS